MTNDDNINISRRTVLGTLGTIGIGGAAAGFGTSAYLNDTESFEGNTLAAGHLDMQVGWEEHYYDGVRNLDCDVEIQVLGEDDSVGEGEVGFPQRGEPIVAVAEEDVPAFMDCTTTDSQSTEHTDDPPDGIVSLDDVKPGDFGEITLCYSIYDNPGYVRFLGRELANDENGLTEPEAVVDGSGGDPGAGNGELGDAIQAVAWYDPGGNNLDDDDVTLLAQGSLSEVLDRGAALLDPAEASGSDAWVANGDGNCHAPGVDCMETLYLTDTGGADSDFDGQTKLFEVTLTQENGDQVAELSLVYDLAGEANFTQVDAIAATPTGEEIYLVDKNSAHLGLYDVAADSFTDLGAVNGLSSGDAIVLATYSPDGTLYVAGQSGGQHLYTVDVNATPPTATDQGSISGVDVQGADIVYGSDGTLYLFSSADGKLYTVDLSGPSPSASPVGGAQTDKGSFTGLSIRGSGTGALVGSSESDNAVVVLDKSDGSAGTTYEMQLAGSDEEYPYGYGDMTVGALCPEYCIAFAWWLPRDVGNEVQSDSYSFELEFQTEQCRNNVDPFANW